MFPAKCFMSMLLPPKIDPLFIFGEKYQNHHFWACISNDMLFRIFTRYLAIIIQSNNLLFLHLVSNLTCTSFYTMLLKRGHFIKKLRHAFLPQAAAKSKFAIHDWTFDILVPTWYSFQALLNFLSETSTLG